MADIFGRNPSPFAGAFAADASTMTIGGLNMATHLIQQMSINYSQPVNTIFEIGSNNRYYVVGRTTGQMSLGKVVGPTVVSAAWLAQMGNVCAAGSRDLSLRLGNSACGGVSAAAVGGALAAATSGAVTLTAKACVATMVGYSLQSQDMLINEQVQLIYGELNRS